MILLERTLRIVIVMSLFFLSLTGLAIPKYERITLPLPTTIDEKDQHLTKEIIQLEVYQDSVDSNQYYFMPPLNIRRHQRGAASMLLNAYNTKIFATAKREMEARSVHAEQYSKDLLERFHHQKNIDTNNVLVAEEKLEEAIILGNEQLILFRQQSLAKKIAVLHQTISELNRAEETIREGKSLLPPGLGRGYFERALLALAQTGMDVPFSGSEDPDLLSKGILKLLDEIAGSYGGFLSLNVYAGFTKNQLEALTTFKAKYLPHIRVSLLPVDKLTFYPLTEMQSDHSADIQSNKMFRQIKGSGDYLGAAIVLDTTISGSLGLSQHLSPFILPIGVTATFKQKLLPAEARLTCDFQNGFTIKGRADLRDGLVIFDNDITNNMTASDESNGACNIRYISGDPDSAKFDALRKLEAEYESMNLQRTYLSRVEKEKYFQGILDDLNDNRRVDEAHYSNAMRILSNLGWQALAIEGLTRAADFHWHTNIQNVSNISSVKFTKNITIAGEKTIEHSLPTNLCLVFNVSLGAYDRCEEMDENNATTMQQASQQAKNSHLCENIIDPFECGILRDNEQQENAAVNTLNTNAASALVM